MKTCIIGGTGRCGTSLVKNILARHKDVWRLPVEHRFTIDPDGIIDFYHNFSTVWSPYWADVRLKRLEKLLYDVSYSSFIGKSLSQLIKLLKIFGINFAPKRYIEIELEKFIPNFHFHINKLMNDLRSFHYKGRRLGTDSYVINPKISYSGIITASDLIGLTFYYSSDIPPQISFMGKEIKLSQNIPDKTDKKSISIPWKQLEYPN